MDRIAEERSESHVQRKLSSQQWPSLSVGLLNGNSILIFSILITCFAGTIAQNAFPMEFDSNPTTNIKPGTPVNLKCSFKLVKDDFNNILFYLGTAQLYDYTSQESFKGLQHGHYLSTNPEVYSVFWVTHRNSFCTDSSRQIEYKCWIKNAERNTAQKRKEISYEGPVLEVRVNDSVLHPTDYSLSLIHDQIDKDVEIKIVAKNLLSAPSNLTLSIGKETLQSKVTPKDDVTLCIYERELIATYRFPKSGDYKLKYSGPPHDATIKVTVKGEGRGISIGWIVTIVLVLLLVVIGSPCLYCFVISKNKDENKKCVKRQLANIKCLKCWRVEKGLA